MENERISHHSSKDKSHRRRRSHRSNERSGNELRKHRERQKRQRSLSPGEIPPEDYRPKASKSRHRSEHRRPSEHKAKSPMKTSPDEEEVSAKPGEAIESSESDDVVGPMPEKSSAQDSAKRRRLGKGEYGHQPEDIERYEKMGFVMSGNRRSKKGGSSNVESSSRPGLLQQREEKALRETELVARFKELAEQQKAMKDI